MSCKGRKEILLELDELDLVYSSMKKYPLIHKWGFHEGSLSQKEALENPQYG